MRARQTFTQEDFLEIKQFQKEGLSTYKTAKLVDRTPSMVWQVYQCKTLQEYRKFQAESRAKYYTAKPQANQGTVFYYILERLDALDQSLEQIKKDLALVPKRRKW